MKYIIDTIDLKQGLDGCSSDLRRNNVTIYPHSLRIQDGAFYAGVMHESPQNGHTLYDVREFEMKFEEAPPAVMAAFAELQAKIEAHYLTTVYEGATQI